jgi:muramidase (phage lysozyme)
MSDFDPNSNDAMFAKVLSELASIRQTQAENAGKLDKALERISSLESFKIWVVGMSAGVSAVVGVVVAAAKWVLIGSSKP